MCFSLFFFEYSDWEGNVCRLFVILIPYCTEQNECFVDWEATRLAGITRICVLTSVPIAAPLSYTVGAPPNHFRNTTNQFCCIPFIEYLYFLKVRVTIIINTVSPK